MKMPETLALLPMPTRSQRSVPAALEHRMTTYALPDHDCTAARPFWLTGPCPDWCTKEHLPHDFDQERHHSDDGLTVQLTLHHSRGSLFEPQPLHVCLFQDPRAIEGYVEIFWPQGNATIRLTLDEAAEAADYINTVVTAATPAQQDGGQG